MLPAEAGTTFKVLVVNKHDALFPAFQCAFFALTILLIFFFNVAGATVSVGTSLYL
jgi:hypothetical protein